VTLTGHPCISEP